ncbi:hypothetical protein EMIT019CA3_70083 [Bacillus pseudomycoides]
MNNIDKWKAVDHFITDLLIPTDSILEEVLLYNYNKVVDYTRRL